MKIDEALVQQGFKDGTIQYEAHERVPLFIVEPDSMLVDGEETFLITETFKTYELGGVLYAKMDSTHKNPDGTFSGAEPTYSNDMSTARQALWAEQYELVTSETFEELRRWDSMTFEEKQAEIVAEIISAKSDASQNIEVISSAKHENAVYTMNVLSYNMLKEQLEDYENGDISVIQIHDNGATRHEDYTYEEAKNLEFDGKLAFAYASAVSDIILERALSATDEQMLANVRSTEYNEDEQAYIDGVLAKTMGA